MEATLAIRQGTGAAFETLRMGKSSARRKDRPRFRKTVPMGVEERPLAGAAERYTITLLKSLAHRLHLLPKPTFLREPEK
jgi:hypothetical protein